MKPATWLNQYFTHDTRGNIYRVLYQPSTHLKDKTIPGCLWLSTKAQGCSLSVEVKFFCKPYSNRSKGCICCGLLSATDYYILESASILSVLSPFMCFLGFWGFLLFCSPPPPAMCSCVLVLVSLLLVFLLGICHNEKVSNNQLCHPCYTVCTATSQTRKVDPSCGRSWWR